MFKPRKLRVFLVLIFLGFILFYFFVRGYRHELKRGDIIGDSPDVAQSPLASPAVSQLPKAFLTQPTPHDQMLSQLLVQILASKNDNDPRLDTEFKNLTPGTKDLLKRQYDSFAPEARNERGTVVFILGRDLAVSGTHEDFAFFQHVANETPCLSLGNCTQAVKSSSEDAHEDSTIGVTLSYPQQMLTLSLAGFIEHNPGHALEPDAVKTLQDLSRSPIPSVAERAKKALGPERLF